MASGAGQGLTPGFVWRVFANWWHWVVPAGLLIALTAVGLVLLLHSPKYEAKALVSIRADVPFVAFQTGGSDKNNDRYVQTQIELLRGPVVLNPLLSRPEIAGIEAIRSAIDPIEYLRARLRVQQVGRSDIFQIAFQSNSPKTAATVANSIVAEYLTVQNREDKQRSTIVIEALEKERLSRSSRLERLRKDVVEMARDLTGRDPFNQGVLTDVMALSPAASFYQELTATEVDLEVLKAELQALQAAPAISSDRDLDTGLLELEIASRDDVLQLQGRIREIEDLIRAVRQQYSAYKRENAWEGDADYQLLTSRLTESKARLESLKQTAMARLRKQRATEHESQLRQRVAAKQAEIATLTKKREMLAERVQSDLEDLTASGAQSAELEFAKAELAREQNVFEMIAARKLALQTEMQAPPRVRLLYKASAPAFALDPIPYKYLLVALGGGLIAPLGLVVLRESLIKRISSGQHLTQESQLPLLGEISRFPARQITGQQQLGSTAQKDIFVYTESIDSLRTTLALKHGLGTGEVGKKVMAVCSAVSGEGKTSVATALALSIAEATGKYTLVIDADLRSPDVSNYLDTPNSPGLAEVLAGEVELRDALHRVKDRNVFVLPAGGKCVNPHLVPQGDFVPELLGRLRAKFSAVFIDTPPVLSASEALVYARASDMVLFCSLSDASRVDQVKLATGRLEDTGANLAGSILSGVSTNRYVYAYGKYSNRPPARDS